jgi:Na+-transporting NADH:ubiquinone oxidoreductase subunit NqrE
MPHNCQTSLLSAIDFPHIFFSFSAYLLLGSKVKVSFGITVFCLHCFRVANKTNHLVNSALSSDDLSPDTRLIFINIIGFAANWEKQFNPSQTSNMPFHLNAQETIE